MPPELLADVAVRATIPGAEPVFTYRVPARLHAFARAGQLVWAPLRRQRVQGIILDLYRQGEDGTWAFAGGLPGAPERPSPLDRLRPDPDALAVPDAPVLRDLIDVADPEAALTPAQVRLARWLSGYYRAPLYDALALMLPPGVAQQAEPTWRATPAGMDADLGALPERERAVLYFLRQRGEQTERELRSVLRGGDAELRESYYGLYERGLASRGAALSSPRARPRTERMVRLLAGPAQLAQAIDDLKRAPKQQAVLEFLRERLYAEVAGAVAPAGDRPPALQAAEPPPPYPAGALYAATGADLATLRALERRSLLELTLREVRRDPLAGDAVPPDIPPQLTPAQARAWQPIADALDRSSAFKGLNSELSDDQRKTQNAELKPFLLHGITGSGKTELYLRAIGRALRHGRQALVLVPEIALTAQLVRRFAARFPGKLAVLHSGLGLGERYDEWRRLRAGTAMLAIGSRSAVFAPLPRLGLIIVDEEHEPSYKHDGAPRYHARDAARTLAELTGSVLILGSATPSVESYAAARAGTFALVALNERVGMAHDAHGLPRSVALPLPPVAIVDMRRELQQGNRSIFSRPLQQALAGALERGEQAILFLNRRGAAAFVMCRDCGHVIACPNCDTPLVLHYEESREPALPAAPDSELVCHSCNHRELVPALCPACWSQRIKTFGVGTQRVVEEVAALFPGTRTLRWDRDSVGRKGDHARLLDHFLRHESDVLVGTQMIAKGLDLPLVSVVGVVAADTGLHLPDFRAGERSFQLLTQVAGRAGRRSAGAQVVLQTYTPDHYALLAAQEHDYAAFFAQEIAFRRQTGYPPFSRLVRFVYTSGSDERGQRAAHELAAEVARIASMLDLGDWGLIGPAPAFFHRQRNRFRWHVLLRAADPGPLLEVLYLPPGWALDVDPVHVL
ncbi:MAG: primosomal protein N' [Kouleothrix sp.]|jgi:primosomal protein N' (replication factor Y)|nr:primosomal protein N' [Kouleothrix sp.]